MDLATVRWLGSPDGWAILRELPAYDPAGELSVQSRLRASGIPAEQAAALLHQSRLRARAREKFGDRADTMLFTRDGLEQATRSAVAQQHADRYVQAGLATVHDLGCGIGSDAMALSAAGISVRAIDADPVTAQVADTNLRTWPGSHARPGLAEDFQPPPDPLRDRVGAWLDPARRIPGSSDRAGRTRRVFLLEELSPPWSFIVGLSATVPATGAKLSPSFSHGDIPPGSEAQWVSWGGDLVECAVWFGPLVRRAGRTALAISPAGSAVEIDESMSEESATPVTSRSDLGSWLYEPDRAVTRAGLVGAVTALTGGAELEPGLGYVSADLCKDVAFARRFAVHEVMPLNVKSLRAWLRGRGITGVTLKQRGLGLDEDRLRHDLRISRKAGSGAQVVLVLTRVAGQSTVLVVEPS